MRRWHSAVVAALAAPLLLAGCGGEPDAPRDGVSAEELTGDVSGSVDLDEARVGGAVSLKGQVVSVPGPGSFELRAVDGATERPVLVLRRHDRIQVDDVVQVAGKVRVLDDRLAEEYGITDSALLAVHDGKRVVEARTADTDVPGDGR